MTMRLLLAAYLGLVGRITLWPTHPDRPVTTRLYAAARDGGATAGQARGSLSAFDVVANVALFVPLGGLLVLAGLRARWAVLLCVALTVAIESAQYTWLTGRNGTLTDVLTNSIGGLLGAAAAARLHTMRQA